jgi:hypothetical protein
VALMTPGYIPGRFTVTCKNESRDWLIQIVLKTYCTKIL